jgi:hypothetical protein
MNKPIMQVARWNKGDPLSARKLNESVDAVNALSGGVRPPLQTPFRGRALEVRQFKVTGMAGDFIISRTWDGTDLGVADVKIAKPYLLRRTPFDGFARAGVSYVYVSDAARTATAGTESETQVVVPAYEVGDVVYAAKGVAGGVGVSAEWLDLNCDGRAWAKE